MNKQVGSTFCNNINIYYKKDAKSGSTGLFIFGVILNGLKLSLEKKTILRYKIK